MVVNVDIRSAALYKSGPLIMLCLEYMEKSPEGDPVQFLGANRLDQQTRRDLLKFIRNLKVHITGDGQPRVKTIKDISEKGADTLSFPLLSGGTITIHVGPIYIYAIFSVYPTSSRKALFRRKTGRTLRYPSVVCVQASRTFPSSNVLSVDSVGSKAGQARLGPAGIVRSSSRPILQQDIDARSDQTYD